MGWLSLDFNKFTMLKSDSHFSAVDFSASAAAPTE
jgi:hypothetical protein